MSSIKLTNLLIDQKFQKIYMINGFIYLILKLKLLYQRLSMKLWPKS